MRSSPLLPIVGAALAGTALAGDAKAVLDNPKGVVYRATLPDEPFFAAADLDGNVKGFITAAARSNGAGVRFHVKFENLPAEGGPFSYHIHKAAAEDGNCTTTLSHLDPFDAGAEVPCDRENLASCEVGDLAGKYGKIESDPFEAHYTDAFASTSEDNEAFFGDLSFVIHYANSTRLTCANFEKKAKTQPEDGKEDDGDKECHDDDDDDDEPTETGAGVVYPPTPTGEVEEPAETPGPDTTFVHHPKPTGDGDKSDGDEPEEDGDEPEEDGDKSDSDEPEGDKPEGDKPEEDGDSSPEQGSGDDDDDQVATPPPADQDGPAPSETPVPAGAPTERLSAPVLLFGMALAAFMA